VLQFAAACCCVLPAQGVVACCRVLQCVAVSPSRSICGTCQKKVTVSNATEYPNHALVLPPPSDLTRLALGGSVAGVVRLTSRAWVWWQARGKERTRTVAMG